MQLYIYAGKKKGVTVHVGVCSVTLPLPENQKKKKKIPLFVLFQMNLTLIKRQLLYWMHVADLSREVNNSNNNKQNNVQYQL